MMMTLAASVSCLSLSRTATVTSCKHEYHLKRDIEWSQRSRECSICWQLFVLKDPARTIYLLASSVHQVLRRELDMVENEKKECISNFSKIAHNPIFFHSPFTVGLWKIFIGNQLDINPSSASEKIFILQLFTYNMWREHNCRTFRQTSSSERAINEGQASLHSGYVVYSSLYARDLILLHCTFQLRMLTSLSVCFPSSLLTILLCFIRLVCFSSSSNKLLATNSVNF
ncbi:uncharacterized protein LOC106431985 isoform X1 [Brassica napus]|uniref:uncharacterized protein LOC106431985 isoform X1 n=1 Tax=Brassica napus TaxID=3708 RepID=UPI00207929B2|nr:uncharacterized protein LOC106431985 isoform X1 [Brassica napus]